MSDPSDVACVWEYDTPHFVFDASHSRTHAFAVASPAAARQRLRREGVAWRARPGLNNLIPAQKSWTFHNISNVHQAQ
jgi:hypothetical protein